MIDLSSFSTIRQLIKRYRLKSIFFVYFKRIFIIIAVPFLILSFLIAFYGIYRMDLASKTSLLEGAQHGAVQLEDLLEETDKCQYQLETDTSVYGFSITDSRENSLVTARYANACAESAMRMATYSNYIENIHIYFPYKGYVISKNESNFLKNHSARALLSGIDGTFARRFVTDTDSGLFRCVYPISKNSSAYAYVAYDVPLKTLTDIASDMSVMILRSDNGSAIYTSDPDSADMLLGHYDELKETPDTARLYNGYAMVCKAISNGQFNIIFSTSKSSSAAYLSAAVLYVPLLLILIIALSAVIAFYFSTHFYNIIADMLQMADSFGFDIEGQKNELQSIEKFFSTVIEKDKNIEKTLISKSYELKQAQSQALQLQINPHFIFNTLNLANVIIMREIKRSNDAEIVIYHLANLIAKILDTKNQVIAVSDELNLLNEFIEIEKIRFNNNFDVKLDISDEIYEKNIISFTLQPIVENAFEHGIKLLDNVRGLLEISAYTKDGDTVFEIKNTCPDSSFEEIARINSALSGTSPSALRGHIGLLNVHRRINLLCGNEYGVSVSACGKLFCTTICYRL